MRVTAEEQVILQGLSLKYPYMKKIKSALLVDDDDTANFLNQRLFDRLGAAESLSVARNGSEALAQIVPACTAEDEQENCPDLILLDIKMPVMNGFEFLLEYSKLRLRRTSVIYLLTSSTNPVDIEKVNGYPLAGVLEKPLTSKRLKEIIEKHF